ncbi:hypothetical protein MKW92_042554, partial [Papaver armeniacum]
EESTELLLLKTVEKSLAISDRVGRGNFKLQSTLGGSHGVERFLYHGYGYVGSKFMTSSAWAIRMIIGPPIRAHNAEYNLKVCNGAKSEPQSKLAARKYARIIQKLRFPDFKIQNIVGSCDVEFPIKLEWLSYCHGPFSSYEPELFPGLIY